MTVTDMHEKAINKFARSGIASQRTGSVHRIAVPLYFLSVGRTMQFAPVSYKQNISSVKKLDFT
eukprot:4375934-Amphidinium_carterae.1